MKSGLNISQIFIGFCTFDDGNLIILFNGFHKKSQKTPKNELEKALKLMAEYFQQKNDGYEKL